MKIKKKFFSFLGIFLIICFVQTLPSSEFTYFTEKFSKLESPRSKGNSEFPLTPFIVVRHAESTSNKERKENKDDQKKIKKIKKDVDLSSNGYLQAEEIPGKVKRLLQEMGEEASISFIVSSSFQRALKTADIFNKGLEKKNQKNVIYVHEGLKEKSRGIRIDRLFKNRNSDRFKRKVLGAFKTILELKDDNANGIPIIFCHRGVIRKLSKHLGVPLKDAENAVPILFIPPQDNNGAWKVKF